MIKPKEQPSINLREEAADAFRFSNIGEQIIQAIEAKPYVKNAYEEFLRLVTSSDIKVRANGRIGLQHSLKEALPEIASYDIDRVVVDLEIAIQRALNPDIKNPVQVVGLTELAA